MAEREWLRQTVDTARRPCPVRLAEECPGHRAGCAWWLEEVLTNTDGQTVQQGGCAVTWLYAIQLEVRAEAIRTQATLTQAGETVRQSMAALTRRAEVTE